MKSHWNISNTCTFLNRVILHTRVTVQHLLQTEEDRFHTELLLEVCPSFRKASRFSALSTYPSWLKWSLKQCCANLNSTVLFVLQELLGVQLARSIFLISEDQWPVCPVRCYRARGSQEDTSVKPGWSASSIIMLARAALQPLLHPRAVTWKQH